jgi:hypothetical protein
LDAVSPREWRLWSEAVRNKVSAFCSNPFLIPLLSAETCLDFKAAMDEGAAIIVNLPDGVLRDSGRLFGLTILARLYAQAITRPEGSRPFYLYLDECQVYAGQTLNDLVLRTRKRGVGVVAATQQLTAELEPFVNSAGTITAFACGRRDAETLSKVFFPATGTEAKKQTTHWLYGVTKVEQTFSVQEERELQAAALVNQQQRECYIYFRGKGAKPATTFESPPLEYDPAQLIEESRAKYGLTPGSTLELKMSRAEAFAPKRRKAAPRD